MPPSNISFLTALDLGTISTSPITGGQDVRDGGINYDVYLKFTAPANPANGINVASVFVIAQIGPEGDTSLFQTIPSAYVGPAGAPQPTPIGLGTSARSRALQFPIEEGNDYFIKIEHLHGNTPTNGNYTYRIQLSPNIAQVVGDILITNDTYPRESAIIDYTTGIVKKFANLPAGELGCSLANGIFGLHDANAGDFKIFNTDLSLRATVALDIDRVCASFTGFFFVAVNGSPGVVYKIDQDGNIITSWNIVGATTFSRGIGVAPDESIIYYQTGSSLISQPIRRWDTVANIQLSTIAPSGSGHFYGPEILIEPISGDLILFVIKNSPLPRNYFLRRITPSGATVWNTDFGIELIDHIAVNPDWPTSFKVWTQPQDEPAKEGLSYWYDVLVSDGTYTPAIPSNILNRQYEGGAYEGELTLTPDFYFGHSFCCPLIVFLAVAPPSVGTIIVNKVTVGGDDEFDFDTVNLIPSSFSLSDGGSQQFDDLVPGDGYSVVEQPKDGWTTSYEVSNGSPHTNITVGAGEVVVVTVINTKLIQTTGGIYKIVPNSYKRNDTYYTNDGGTEDVKIPDPFARGYGLG